MPDNQKIRLTSFALKNIDDERTAILAAPSTSAYEVSRDRLPYSAAIETIDLPSYDRKKTYQSSAAWYSQAGLAVKTYLSDRFNNWLNTEWIDGTKGGYRDWETDRKSTRLNSSHSAKSRMPSSA